MKNNESKRYKVMKFTFDEVDTIEDRLNAVVQMIEDNGGTVICTLDPVTFGFKPVLLVYTICYRAKAEINGEPLTEEVTEVIEKESERNGESSHE